ncbi:MAG: hypothetical protein BMS9Abin15_0583 [Gammaproteobacteria bacterium]|nr:MAG: hypothetical protein BMS9Abin15_0583 [Gammaproteobacteria bacterium]
MNFQLFQCVSIKKGAVALLWLFLAQPVLSFALPLTVDVYGERTRANGKVHGFRVEDGDAMRPGDRFQIRIRPGQDAYVYVVHYGSSSQASLIYPFRGVPEGGLVKSGEWRVVPGPDLFFTLDDTTGRELMFVLASDKPIRNLGDIFAEMQQVGGSDPIALQGVLERAAPRVKKVEIKNIGPKGNKSGVDILVRSMVNEYTRRYQANPWPETEYGATLRQRRRSIREDESIPEAVRQRSASLKPSRTPKPRTQKLAALSAPAPAKTQPPAVSTQSVVEPPATPQVAARTEPGQAAVTAPPGQNERATKQAAPEEPGLMSRMFGGLFGGDEKSKPEQPVPAKQPAQSTTTVVTTTPVSPEPQTQEPETIASATPLVFEPITPDKPEVAVEPKTPSPAPLEEQANEPAAEEILPAIQAEQKSADVSIDQAPVPPAEQPVEEVTLAAVPSAQPATTQKEATPEQPGFLGRVFGGMFGGGAASETDEPISEAVTVSAVSEPQAASKPAPQEQAVKTTSPVRKPAPPPQQLKPQAVPARPKQVVARAAPPRPAIKPVPVQQVYPNVKGPIPQDPEKHERLSSSVVTIRSGGESGIGVVLDGQGHVITNWHVIQDASAVQVQFLGIAGARPVFTASVVHADKFSDLVLLKINNPPEGLLPAELAIGEADSKPGTQVRVVGEYDGTLWVSDDAILVRVSPHFSWFSGQNVIHRGEVLHIKIGDAARELARLLITADYRILGLHGFTGKESGRMYAISTKNISKFLKGQPVALQK